MSFMEEGESYATLTVGQLVQLLDGVEDKDKEIRVWCEEINCDGASYLSGRRLIGMTDEDDLCTLCAVHYHQEETK